MKLTAISFLLFILPATLLGQGLDQDDYYQEGDSSVKGQENQLIFTYLQGPVLQLILMGGTVFSTFVAPAINHQLSPRWSVDIGAALVNSDFNRWTNYSFDNSPSINGNTTDQYMYVRANYQASDKMTLFGGVYHHLLSLDPLGGSALSMSGNTYVVGMEYKISRGFTFGVQMSRSTGNPFNQSPFIPSRNGLSPFSSFGSW